MTTERLTTEMRSQLPELLRERTIVIEAGRAPAPAPALASTPAPAEAPPFVMYWMRTSARAHDNPALDVARAAAEAMGLPVFVYLGLSERHPYSSARHHWFFIEGARDVEAECAELGVGFAFHLERAGHRGPHLLTLAQQAALVVTEDLPVSPLEAWSAELASQISAPVWAVDAACTWPMRKVAAKETLRAFKFRKVTERQRLERIRAGWPMWGDGEAGAPSAAASGDGAASIPFVPELPFEPVRLAHLADDELQRAIAELISTCRIDHGVAPVPHTRGGSRAGYARWDTFKAKGLRHYHRTRNDPLRDGVSRMSAYLHFGHVSPFRVAREALEIAEGQRDEGAEKYLDELLTWRELAHSWCAHHADRDSLNAIPSWARETLAAHERDPRPALFSWESLARARTGDVLWDAAQQSLLIHGELHNNVRMTWGKALLGWTRTADEALAKLIDLNHRYALDGRDPASYGGLLWCLGQFDRPFEPEERIIGTVRPRPTDHHARRLNAAEYSRRTGRPAVAKPPQVAVIGAGISGLACARTLRDHGIEVRVFDKGRRPGGRLATRESRDQTGVFFDHGAQYFTAHDDRFARYVASWAEDGVVATWHGRVVDIPADGAVHERPAAAPRWVGVGGMNAVAAHVAADVEVECGVRVDGLTRREDGWWLTVEWLGEPAAQGPDAGAPNVRALEVRAPEFGPFDAVVLTVPPVQAVPLLSRADAPKLQTAAESAEMLPCWTLMVELAAPLGVDFEGARFVAGDAESPSTSDGALAWIKRQDSTRSTGAGPSGERWVLQASAAWSAEHLERDAAEVEAAMLADLAARLSEFRDGHALPELLHTSTHRWRYARPHDGPGSVEDERRIVTDERGLVLAGDWVAGKEAARVEAAWLSGVAAAGHLLTSAIAAPLEEGAERGGPPCFSVPGGRTEADDHDETSNAQPDLFG